MRLDKYISNHTGLSRKDAKLAIKNGDVIVANDVITQVDYPVNENTKIRLEGQLLAPIQPRYFMLNKPPHVVCANRDGHHATVMSLLFEEDTDSLHAAGRLDIDTTGLVLITDDGQWSHRITAPKHKLAKHYQVHLYQPLTKTAIKQLQEGVLLHQENKRTKPAIVNIIEQQRVELIIQEGKYHQVKRMFAAVGNHVVKLHRSQIGSIVLDDALNPGDYRPLTQVEIDSVSAL